MRNVMLVIEAPVDTGVSGSSRELAAETPKLALEVLRPEKVHRDSAGMPRGKMVLGVKHSPSVRLSWLDAMELRNFLNEFLEAPATPESVNEARERILGADPHSDDVAIDKFAAAMKKRMAEKRAEGYRGWDDKAKCPPERLARLLLLKLVGSGNPVDAANYLMMLFNRDAADVISQVANANPTGADYILNVAVSILDNLLKSVIFEDVDGVTGQTRIQIVDLPKFVANMLDAYKLVRGGTLPAPKTSPDATLLIDKLIATLEETANALEAALSFGTDRTALNKAREVVYEARKSPAGA